MSTPNHNGTLRDRIAAALREHYLSSAREAADADRRMPCACGDWREPSDMDGDEYDWDSHLADAVLPLVAAEREAGRRAGMRADTAVHADGHSDGLDLGDVQDLAPARDCPAYNVDTPHTEHCPTPETHNWGCGCPGDQAPRQAVADSGTFPALSEPERTMLTYALDQAQEAIWSEVGFTEQDQAAVTSLRRLTMPARADAEDGTR